MRQNPAEKQILSNRVILRSYAQEAYNCDSTCLDMHAFLNFSGLASCRATYVIYIQQRIVPADIFAVSHDLFEHPQVGSRFSIRRAD